jgi:glycosyltransferase involved in cell wall biosynthesis
MNLLYITNNSNNIDAGLNWSVPAGVKAQQKYDNVLWVDLTIGAYLDHWGEVEAYHNIRDFGDKISLDILPAPFDCPDCVVFESFYYMEQVKFSWELRKKNIPYIIIPRGALTADAFNNGNWLKYLKKKVAHLIFFNSFINNAVALQYLTQKESEESHKTFSKESYIIPNGFSTPEIYKEHFSEGIRTVFIGRQDIYQKGFDLLLNSIKELHEELKKARFTLDIYGPPRYDVKRVTELINELGIDDIVVNHERGVSGEEKQRVLLSADVFVLTSRFEGHPMSLIEALAYGLPSLITRGANMYEEVKNANAGWVCETTQEGVKNALRQMIKAKPHFKEISLSARQLASLYDWDELAKQFHDKLMTLLH